MDTNPGTLYRTELMAQPAVLASTAAALIADSALLTDLTQRVNGTHLDQTIITGMGGSLFASQPLALRLAMTGRPVTLIDTAELLHTCPALIGPRSLLIIVSQSGETIEVVRLLEQAGRPGALVSITNGRANTLARAADYSLATTAGAERSVASKSYVTSLLALDALGQSLTGQPLALERWQPPIEAVGSLLASAAAIETALSTALTGMTPLYLLGRGASLASAMAGALLIKESSRRPAEGMSAAQFRHGPLEMIAPGMGVLLFAPAAPTRPLIVRLAAELADYGIATVVIGPAGADRPAGVTWLPTPSLDPWVAPVAEIVPLQLLGDLLARSSGHETGYFARLEKVTRQE